MIVVEPKSSRFEVGEAGLSTDEHLLERISATENRVSRLTERLERSLDLLLRQAQNAYFDRSLVKALIGLLADDGVVETSRLEQLWSSRCQKDAVEQEESVHRDELRLSILASANVTDRRSFEELVNEGFLLIEDKQITPGINKLQRAAEISNGNPALNLFIGEHFFRSGKTKLARNYLAKAHHALPDDLRIKLLLGLTCADDGEVELAKDLLSNATERGGSSFAGHYGLGWLFVAENNWRRALGEFKRALSVRPSPEAHYVLGCLYYQMNRDALAVRHLRSATEMDENYAEAFYLLSRVYRRMGRKEVADQILKKAESNTTSSPVSGKTTTARIPKVAPLFQVSTSRSRRLITGVDRRLAEALREDALQAFTRREAQVR
jgi:tetratricopeptide (TPR) repeat protein